MAHGTRASGCIQSLCDGEHFEQAETLQIFEQEESGFRHAEDA